MKKKDFLLLSLILLIGIFFRYYLIKEMPGGLFPDEAANGLDINNIFKGYLEPFFARGNGREALFFYLEALSALIFGRGVWQFHIVSAAVGVASIFTTYLLVKRLFGVREGLVSAYLMAVGSWAVVISRTAFRANLTPLFTTLVLYFVVRVVQAQTKKDRYWSAFFAGLFFAGGFYTYIAFRIMAAVLFFLVLFVVIQDRKEQFAKVKQFWKPALLAIGTFIIFFLPIGLYFYSHPGSFIGRSGQVSVFNPDLNHGHLLSTIWTVAKESLLGFFTQGDLNWRHNIAGEPFMPRLVQIFFGIGLIVMTWKSLKFVWHSIKGEANYEGLKYLPITLLFWGMLLPVITTAEGIPHGLRSLGMLPAAYAIAGISLVYFARAVLKVWHPLWMEKLYLIVAIIFFAALALTTYSQYFVYAYNEPENFDAFRSDLTTVSKYLNEHPNKDKIFLVLDTFSVQTVDYLTTDTGNKYQKVDPKDSPKIHLKKGDIAVFTLSTMYDASKFLQTHKNTKITTSSIDKFGRIEMLAIEMQENDKGVSSSRNNDGSFYALNLDERIYFQWDNQSFDPWTIKIWECAAQECKDAKLLKENEQNDYLANYDWIEVASEERSKDHYFEAIAYDNNNNVIKDFGIVHVTPY